MPLKKLTPIFFLLFSTLIYAEGFNYGFFVNTYPQEEIHTSSLILENNKEIRLGKNNTLSFDMMVRRDNAFGTVFRIITNTNENIDLIFTVDTNDKRYPLLVTNETVHPLSQEVTYNEWIPVSIILSSQDNQIMLTYGTEKLSVPFHISNSNSVRISFGKCLFENFTLPDIASINLRDISFSENGKAIRYWKLEKHDGHICYDTIAKVPAIGVNPNWLLDKYVSWNKIYSKQFPKSAQLVFNVEAEEFYIVTDAEKIIALDVITNQERNIPVKSGSIASTTISRLLYDPLNNHLISYNIEENIKSIFSFDSQTWSNNINKEKEALYWNNTAVFDPISQTILSFGGYGQYKYTNELIRIKLNENKEEKVILTEITPRYTASSILYNNTLYIFGGRGCKSGRQELFQRNYYDLYKVNLQTNEVEKIWETEIANEEFLPGESLIYDEKSNCFYVLMTKDNGTLMKIDPDNNKFEALSLPIGINLDAYTLYTNLYYSPKNKMMYAVINKMKADESSDLSIYSMPLPTISLLDLMQTSVIEHSTNSESSIPYWIIIIVVALIMLAIALSIFRKNKVSIKSEEKTAYQSQPNNQDIPQPVQKEKKYYDFSKQSICLLGEFNVRDKDGNDITSSFTPILKHLLVLLILFSQKNEKGISGVKLIQLLWPDKNKDSAKNNRNVYMSKLRSILEKVGNIEISFKNDFWAISFDKDIKCDYVEAMNYFDQILNGDIKDESLDKLLELLLRGILLPNTEADWVDNFKSDFSNLTIDTFSNILKNRSDYSDHLKIRIADTILLHDYINEEALQIKCSVLYNSGKKGVAKNVYDNFCKEYYNLLDTNYKKPFSEVIK